MNDADVEFPTEGALLGIDFGTKRVGLAISTPDQTIASPCELLQRQGEHQDGRTLCKICKEFRVRGLVVGLPVHMSGDEGEKAKMARQYGNWVSSVTKLPVRYWDERFTTSMADNYLRESGMSAAKRKKRLDALAAQVMLQAYLDANDRDSPPSAIVD